MRKDSLELIELLMLLKNIKSKNMLTKKEEQIIQKIKTGKSFAIKHLNPKDFSFEITKYIIENCDFTILVDCYSNIPEKSKKVYHDYFVKKLKEIESQKQRVSEEVIKHCIEYIEIDLYMSETEKMYHRYELRKGIDIN